MPNPLASYVTRPDSFSIVDNYGAVVARGDHALGDYDFNDAQRILRQDAAAFMRLVLVDGAAAIEAGGSIGAPQNGVIIGADALGSAGTYIGVESQVYSVSIVTGGAGGTATFTWRSSGTDRPDYAGQTFPITAIAPSLLQAQNAPNTYGHAIGVLGVRVYFINPTGQMHGGSAWEVQATYGAQLPTVAGATITVPDVLVPVEGRIHRAAGATLTYAAASAGISVVYAEWTRTLVTNVDDPNLTDPLSGDPQAFRERWTVVLRNSDTSNAALGSAIERRVFPLYQWDRATNVVTRCIRNPYAIDIGKTQGALTADRLLNIDQSEVFKGELSLRMREPLGSFVVDPAPPTPRVVPSTNAANAGKLRFSIPPIVAYVEGVRVVTAMPSTIEIDQATDFKSVADEPFTYTTGTSLYSVAKGIAGYPIKALTKLTAYVAVVNVAMTRGASATDTIPYGSIISIQAVKKGGTTYVATTDYTVAGSVITWVTPDVGATNPAQGDSYTIDLTYNKTMIYGTDYVLTGNQVDFDGAPGDNPVNGTQPQVDYQYYLPRTDLLILRANGAIEAIRGIPAEVAEAPTVPPFVLPLAQIAVPPNSSSVVVTAPNNDRVTMVEINAMRLAIRELFVNFALQDLSNQARTLNTARLLDVFAEAFATDQVADLTYNVGGVAFDATVDTLTQEVTLPYTEALFPLAYSSTGSTVRVGVRWWTLPYTEEVAIDNPVWSTDYPVNPYADFSPEPPLIRLSPDRDFWIDTTLLSSTKSRVVQNGRHIDARIVRRYSTVTVDTRDVPAQFMRQIAASARVFHLVPGERIRCLFDGKVIPITAVAPATQIDANTITAQVSDATHRYGEAPFTYTVPANVPAGTASVQIWGNQGGAGTTWPTDFVKRAEGIFTSNGIERTTATTTIKVAVQNDPVAQSFTFPSARMVTKVEVPIMAAPTPGAATPPLIFELRATDRSGEASTPTYDVLARVSREAADTTSPTVSFDDPVYFPANEFRSLVLRSASNGYRVGVAQLGQADRVNGGFVGSQQIAGGIFMDSANNSDWTAHQGWDLRCKVYVMKASSLSATLRFNAVAQANTTGFYLAPDQVTPDGTSITWQYSVDAGATWLDCKAFTITELAAVVSSIIFRATLVTSDAYVTPAINIANPVVTLYSNKTAGKYVAKQFALPGAAGNASRITGRLEVLEPVGSNATAVYVSVDDGATWSVATLTTKGTLADGYVAKEFDKTGLTAGAKLRVRLDLSTGNRAVRPRARRLFAYAQT